MMQGLFGTEWLSGAFGARRVSGHAERAGTWSGQAVAAEPVTEGLVAGTLVATEMGWQPVESLSPGDRVVTFDNGMQPLRALGRGKLYNGRGPLPQEAQPMVVPARALGNRREMLLLAGQSVLIESDIGEARYGDPFTLVQATALEGWRGIKRAALPATAEVYWLEFEGDEIVYTEGTVLAHCPRRQAEIVATVDELIATGRRHAYMTLPPAQSRALIAEIRAA